MYKTVDCVHIRVSPFEIQIHYITVHALHKLNQGLIIILIAKL